MALTVSVAMATYNGGRFVEEQVRSILEQVPAPTQLVVADDGSTDATLATIARVAAHHPDVTLTVLPAGPEPLRVAANFSRAIEAATGDLVALSDQDDRWHPGRLAAIVTRFEAEPELEFLHHDAELVDADGAALGQRLLDWLRVGADERERLHDGRAFSAYLRRNTATGATVVFRRSLADRALPIGEGWIHDEWFAAVSAASGGARLDDRALGDYRQHGGNEIGVARPTPGYLLRRMVAPRGDRYDWLASRSIALVERLESVGADERWLQLARRKAVFETERSAYPANRLLRLGPVWRNRRGYASLSSQGRLDLLRDILAPA